jgi:hypothetical protein
MLQKFWHYSTGQIFYEIFLEVVNIYGSISKILVGSSHNIIDYVIKL